MNKYDLLVDAKAKANNLFKDDKALKAFECLDNALSPYSFLKYCKGNKHFKKNANVFFVDFLGRKSSKRKKYLSTNIADDLLDEYFKFSQGDKFKEYYYHFEKTLIFEFPELYKSTIRKGGHFLKNDKRTDFWKDLINETDNYGIENEIRIWITLKEKENEFWSNCNEELQKLNGKDGRLVLYCLNQPINDIIKRIVNGVPEPVAIQKITRPVNLFLNYCMVHCEFGNTDNLESPLEQNKTIEGIIDFALERILRWYDIKDHLIDVYLYEEKLIDVSEKIRAGCPEKYYNHLLGQKRLNMTLENSESVSNSIEHSAPYLYLETFKIDIVKIWGMERYDAYESMKDIIDYSTKSNEHIHFWEEAAVNKIIPVPKKNPLVYSIQAELFDRFRLSLESEVYPVINIGDTYFTMNVFQKYNHQMFTLNKLLLSSEDNTSQNKASKNMEDDLAMRFKNKGWNSKSETELTISSNKRYLNGDEGDVDVYLEDDTAQILIQFKRNILRTELNEINTEKASDKKAIKQLNDALVTFQSNPSKYPLKHPLQENVVKWVISTSHEWIGMIDEGVRKVNYFDVLFLLRQPRIRSVKQLIIAIEEDKMIKDYLNEDPLIMVDPQNYVLNLDISEKNVKNIEKYYKALELNRKKKKKEAIKLLNNCLKNTPKDPIIHSEIANIYADLEQWNDAYDHFEKALETSPLDPWINRNYGMTQIEQRKMVVIGLDRLLRNGRRFQFLYCDSTRTLLTEAQELTLGNFRGGRITEHDFKYLT